MGKAQKKQEQELRAIKGKSKASEKAAKKATAAKAKRDKPAKNNKTQSVVVSAASTSERPEPPYRYEIHVKNAQCIVEVTLNKVPPSVIDISKTTRRKLVVDCGAYTKKWLLEFDLPHNMTIDPEKADYTFENGILKCVLTSDTGAVPDSAKKEREEFINKVRDQKHLRFRTTKEGDLVVRSKLAGLKMKEEKQQKKAEKQAAAAAAAVPTPAPTERKIKKSTETAAPSGTSSKYLSDGDVAAMAATIASDTKADIKNKVKALKQKQSNLENRAAERVNKKEARKEKQTGVFKRVVDEQKRKLAERLALAMPKPKDTSGRKVSFQ